jgi:hypothetical protein
MISLKRAIESDDSMLTAESGKADYGYGTCLSLDDDQVKALGAEKFTIGQRVKITSFGVITSLSVEPDEKGEAPDMRIQLTEMEVSTASSVDASSMYPSSPGLA